eukprot:g5091.t1
MPKPKSYLDKVVAAIAALGEADGSSRAAIKKYVLQAFQADNKVALAKALKTGIAKGKLEHGSSTQRFKVKGMAFKKKDDGFRAKDIRVGDGEREVEHGSTVVVSYKGTLEDGTVFDSAKKFTFVIGAGEVIKGWDKGFMGMRVGGKRRLVCPPAYAYGKRGSPPDIPPNATLTFKVKLLKVV